MGTAPVWSLLDRLLQPQGRALYTATLAAREQLLDAASALTIPERRRAAELANVRDRKGKLKTGPASMTGRELWALLAQAEPAYRVDCDNCGKTYFGGCSCPSCGWAWRRAA